LPRDAARKKDTSKMADSSGGYSASSMFVPGETERAAMKVISVAGEAFHRHSDFDAVDALIMMVDDELLNIEMTQAFLEDAGYRNFVSTHESEHAIRMMLKRPPHVLLLDLSMPKVSGLDILARLREDEQLRLIPVIVLTGNTDAGSKLSALSMGATDFLSKPVDPSELALRLRNTLAARAHRDYLANHDALTGLRNRACYKRDLDAVLASATKGGHNAALLHIGVDRLGQINDALGRATGDQMIYRIGKRVSQAVEAADMGGPLLEHQASVYRFDGDEFAVLVPYLEEVEAAAGLINTVLEASSLRFSAREREVFVTASVGVTVFPLDGRDADSLISNAGVAMRQAKQAGRNTYEFFSPRLNERAMSVLRVGGDMRRALGRDELAMLYTPKVDVRTGKVVGAETVVRWSQSGGKVFEGDAVLQMAGTSEMSMVLGEWMMEQVVSQSKAWSAAGLQAVPLGLNVPLSQFPLPQLMELVGKSVREGLKGEWLCLELGELATMVNPELAVKATTRLRELGIRVALDHFGTAETSLIHLNAGLLLNEIKLDASLAASITDKGKGAGAAIVHYVVSMARALRLDVVVTGVDRMVQLATLKDSNPENCAYQGLLNGPAVNAEDFAARFLKAR
jgi:diguanylate cyclase (GGDEF)-like protein